MTQEQINDLIEMVETYQRLDKYSFILSAVFMASALILGIIILVYCNKKTKQINNIHQDYLSTLNDEQLDAIKRNKKYNL